MHTAIYVRVSTEGQRTNSQEQELKRYCRQRGWKNPVVYSDKISRAKTSRPELNRRAALRLQVSGKSCSNACVMDATWLKL